MTDVVPELLEKINSSFDNKIEADKTIAEFREKLKDGKASQFDVIRYNRRLAGHASKALTENLTTDVLPDGVLYYNIGERTVKPTLKKVNEITYNAAAKVTEQDYAKMKIGISPQSVEFDDDRIDTFLYKLREISEEGDKLKFAELLGGPFENICESYMNDYVDTQAKFAEKAGVKATISRYSLGKCCDWCDEITGTYDYATAPKDIYRKHDNCNCFVVYKAEKTYQDVWSKKTFASERAARIDREKTLIKEAEKKDAARAERLRKLLEEDLRR